MNWLEILVISMVGFVGFALLGALLLCLFVIARQQRGVEELKKTNKALAEQIVAAHETLAKACVPVNLSISEEQVVHLAAAINNVRALTNLPNEKIN